MQEARNAYEAGDFTRAEELLLELVEFAPSELRAWQLLARSQKALGKIRQAIRSAEKAIELQNAARTSADMPASLTLARLLWQQGDHASARAMLALLLMRQPECAELIELKQQWSAGVSE